MTPLPLVVPDTDDTRRRITEALAWASGIHRDYRLREGRPMSDTLPLLLPDVPGRVHGIVSLDPPTVQCDGCCATYTARTLARAVLGSGFHFNPRREHDHRRLCRDCAKEAGWER